MCALLRTTDCSPEDVTTLLHLAVALLVRRLTGRMDSPEHPRYGAAH